MKKLLFILTITISIKANGSELDSYTESFFKDLSISNYSNIIKNYEINFGPTFGDVIGYCSMSHYHKKIVINREFWQKSTEIDKKALFYHEMAHCVCNALHDPVLLDFWLFMEKYLKINTKNLYLFSDGCPKSIMYPNMTTTKCNTDHWEDYLLELKNKCSF